MKQKIEKKMYSYSRRGKQCSFTCSNYSRFFTWKRRRTVWI